VIGQSRTDGDMCRDRGGGIVDMLLQLGFIVWVSKPPVDSLPGLGLKIQDGVRGNTWHHRKACVEAKYSHEWLVVECTYLYLDN
jgi:hypothetical protein